MADIRTHNIQTVHSIYHQPVKSLGHPTPPLTAHQRHHLPGDIYAFIKTGGNNRGSGVNADSIDAFIDLVSLNTTEINSDICQLFDLVYNNMVPVKLQYYLRDSYLFCLYKDPEDLTKL